jgi:hypothetical protein
MAAITPDRVCLAMEGPSSNAWVEDDQPFRHSPSGPHRYPPTL